MDWTILYNTAIDFCFYKDLSLSVIIMSNASVDLSYPDIETRETCNERKSQSGLHFLLTGGIYIFVF